MYIIYMSKEQVDSIPNYYFSREGKYIKDLLNQISNINDVTILAKESVTDFTLTKNTPKTVALSSNFVKHVSNSAVFNATVDNNNNTLNITKNNSINNDYMVTLKIKFGAISTTTNDHPIKLSVIANNSNTLETITSYNRTSGNTPDVLGYACIHLPNFSSGTFRFEVSTPDVDMTVDFNLDVEFTATRVINP